MTVKEIKIKCPKCDTVQDAVLKWQWNWRVHTCEKCGYTITESEWQEVKRKQELPKEE